MSECKLNKHKIDFLKLMNAGYFALELYSHAKSRLFVDEKALSLLDANPSFSPEELFDFYTSNVLEEDRKVVGSAIQAALVEGKAEFNFFYKGANSQRKLLRCFIYRAKDEEQPGIRIEGTVREIIDSKNVGKADDQYQSKLFDTFYLIPFIGYIKEVESGQILAVTKQFLDLIGESKLANVIGHKDVELWPNGNERAIQDEKYALSLDRPFVVNQKVLDHNGNERYLQTTRLKYINTFGKTNILGLAVDITETHTLLEQRQKVNMRARIKADEANQAKTCFLYNVSNDLRNPVNTILGLTEKAIRHKDDEVIVMDSVNKIKDNSTNLIYTLNGIMDIVSIQSGKANLNETVNCFTDVVKESANLFNSIAEEKNINIRFDLKCIREKYAFFDKEKLGQIVYNLIDNAIKFNNPGGNVYIKGKQTNSKPGYLKFILSISDDGIGMSNEFLTKIFQMFEQERKYTETGLHGSGIGMAIVKALVDMMKGDISIKSSVNQGTTVEVSLSLKIADPALVEKAQNEKHDLSFAYELAKGKRVLIAEDDDISRETDQDLLKEFGFEVETAVNGAAAINIISRKGIDKYSLVFLDLNMPVMDGYETALEIKSLYPDNEVPIIAMSSKGIDDIANYIKQSGMSYEVNKPLDAEKIKDLVIKYLDK